MRRDVHGKPVAYVSATFHAMPGRKRVFNSRYNSLNPLSYPIYEVMIVSRCSTEQLIHYACLSVPLLANKNRLVTVPVNRNMLLLRMAIRMNL